MQQIPISSQFERMTTPLTVEIFHNDHTLNVEEPESHPLTLELKSYQNVHNEPDLFLSNHKIYPNHQYDARRQVEEPNRYDLRRQIEEPNHRYAVRRQEKEIYEPRPFEYILRGTPPTAFQAAPTNSSKFPQIPKEYVGNVDSIQDILRQIRDNKGNDYQDSSGMHKIKIAGTYKHRKVDDMAKMFEQMPRKNRGQNIDQSLLQSHSFKTQNVIKDPFYKYKPNSLSEVNLMATNQFRFAPYSILTNKYVPKYPMQGQPMDPGNGQSMDPGSLYHQIIIANKNRLKYSEDNAKNDNIQGKQKPFTLMLDVYPMPDDEHVSSTVTYPLPVKYQNHINPNMMRHPGINSINNLQPFFHNANYSQLKPNRYPHLPHYHNDNYFRKFATKQVNSAFSRPVDGENNSNNPSQITVHLNLFPKNKERSDNINAKDDTNLIGIRPQDRIAKINDKLNITEEYKTASEEPINLGNISNKIDMDVFKNETASNIKHSVIMIDDSDVDSSEDIFSREFLEYKGTVSPIELKSDSTISFDNVQHVSIPTILPIEPRGYSHKLDMSLFKTL